MALSIAAYPNRAEEDEAENLCKDHDDALDELADYFQLKNIALNPSLYSQFLIRKISWHID